MSAITIGKLAKENDVNVETIRFYERKGIMPKPYRSTSGYRLYSDDDLKRLHFILLAKKHGFTLSEIKDLLELRVDPFSTCEEVKTRADQKIMVIEEKIAELQSMKRALTVLASNCHGDGPAGECPILDAFEIN